MKESNKEFRIFVCVVGLVMIGVSYRDREHDRDGGRELKRLMRK